MAKQNSNRIQHFDRILRSNLIKYFADFSIGSIGFFYLVLNVFASIVVAVWNSAIDSPGNTRLFMPHFNVLAARKACRSTNVQWMNSFWFPFRHRVRFVERGNVSRTQRQTALSNYQILKLQLTIKSRATATATAATAAQKRNQKRGKCKSAVGGVAAL